MLPGEDLTGLLAPAPAPASGFRQGTVLTFDPATGANTVGVGGATLTDLPLLNTSDAVNLLPNDVVVLMHIGSSWAILGRVVAPSAAALNTAAIGVGSIAASVTNFALTTAFVAVVSRTVTAPAWATSATVHATAEAAVENPTASNDLLYLRATIAEVSGGTMYAPAKPVTDYSRYAHVAASAAREFTVTGGQVLTVSADLRSSVGAWAADTDNIANLHVTAVFRKV